MAYQVARVPGLPNGLRRPWHAAQTSASAGSAATCSDTAVSGTMRYTYRPSRCRSNACMSSNDTAFGLWPVRVICSALANIR
jgi:hypothetical protein